MNTKKDATNKNSFFFKESARPRNVDFIFCGIHTFKFIDHSNQAGKDITSPVPAEGMEVASSETRVQPGDDGAESRLLKIDGCADAKDESVFKASLRIRCSESI
jgi:hypothetical protein